MADDDGRGGAKLGEGVARWLLRRCAPRDTEVAMADLEEERARGGRVSFWLQLLSICAWGMHRRVMGGALRPLHALRMAVRGLVKTPGTALAAALTLGLGLTATVALIGTFLGSFRPLPVPDGADIVQLRVLDARAEPVAIGSEVMERWRSPSGPLLGVGATRSAAVTVVRDGEAARRATAAAVTPGTLEFLGIAPLRGRVPAAGPEDRDAVLVREDLWSALAPDGAAPLGSTLRVDGRPMVVVGVMPSDFGFPESHELWTVLPPDEVATADQVVARLRPDAVRDRAAAALAAALGPELAPGATATPERVRILDYVGDRGEGGETVAFAALGVLVALLLVICTANASTLLMVRAQERVGSLAVHSAMGASRLQVVLHLLLEALLVAGVGGLLGLAGGGLILRWSEATLAPHWGYYWMRMEMQPGVIAATAAVVVGCALVAGTLPALRAVRTDLREVLVSGGGRSGGAGRRRAARWFVGMQVTLSTVGLVVALILTSGFARSRTLLEALPLDEVAVASFTLDGDTTAHRALLEALREELAGLPGVAASALSVGVPGYANSPAPLMLADDPSDGEGRLPTAFWMAADPSVLETWDLTLVAGRPLSASDAAGTAPVALVTRSFATRWFEGLDPLGRRLRLEGVHGDDEWVRVVGVVEDWYAGGEGNRPDRIVLALAQITPRRIIASVRGRGDAANLVPHLRQAFQRVDAELAPDRIETMASLVAWLTRMPRAMGGFGAAGGLAGVLVASIGLFGVLSFRVRSRLPAVGVRMALGARRSRILREVLTDAARSVAPWIAAGLGVALLIAPATVIFSFGAPFRAPGTYLGAGLLMLAVVLAAALPPAARAARLDPLSVLRGE